MSLKRTYKRAIQKNIEYDLDTTWLRKKLKQGKCEVTSLPFKLRPRSIVLNPFLPSIDRIDSNKGYTKDNCQLVIVGFNSLKSNFNTEDITEFCKGYVKYYENLLG